MSVQRTVQYIGQNQSIILNSITVAVSKGKLHNQVQIIQRSLLYLVCICERLEAPMPCVAANALVRFIVSLLLRRLC